MMKKVLFGPLCAPVAYSLFDDLHARFTPRAWLARLVGRKVDVPALDEMHE